MRTKAYSMRLQYGDEHDEALMILLDEIDLHDEDSGEWLRDAAKEKLIASSQQKSAQTEVLPFTTDQVIPFFLDWKDNGLPGMVKKLLISMSQENLISWIREAISMRVAIETNAPEYFMNRWKDPTLIGIGNSQEYIPEAEDKLAVYRRAVPLILDKVGEMV